jgi:agmatine/peptidylarginine deiminase
MSEDLKDILSNLNPDIDQETLMRYLQGKLTAEEQHEVEKGITDNDFDSDAIEGLQNFKDKRNIASLVDQLKKDLQKKTEKKKRFKEKIKLKLEPWLIVAIVLILLLAVISFMVVRKQMNGS